MGKQKETAHPTAHGPTTALELYERIIMLTTVRAVVKQGHIELLDHQNIPDGTELLVTILKSSDQDFWTAASQSKLDSVWNNTADDIYEQLLTR